MTCRCHTSRAFRVLMVVALFLVTPISEGLAQSTTSPQATRYFFAPSAIQLKQGEGYFQSNVALNSVSYGKSDALTAGAMVGFFGGGIVAKAGWKVGEKTRVGAGFLGVKDFFGELSKPLALGFVNLTRGDGNKNVTLNLGCTNRAFGTTGSRYSADASSEQNVWGYTFFYPEHIYRLQSRLLVLNVSGMLPLTANSWLISENYLVSNRWFGRIQEIPHSSPVQSYNYVGNTYAGEGAWPGSEETLVVSLGLRSRGKRSDWLWDYGLVAVISEDDTDAGDWILAPLPWFSFTVEF